MISRNSDREHSKGEDEEAEGVREKEKDSDKDAITSKVDNERLCSLEERKVDRVWRDIWPHLNCYLLPVDDYTRWFLMDEVRTCLFLLLYFLLCSRHFSFLLLFNLFFFPPSYLPTLSTSPLLSSPLLPSFLKSTLISFISFSPHT